MHRLSSSDFWVSAPLVLVKNKISILLVSANVLVFSKSLWFKAKFKLLKLPVQKGVQLR